MYSVFLELTPSKHVLLIEKLEFKLDKTFMYPLPRRLCFRPCQFVGWMVDLSAGLHKKYSVDLHETWYG